MSDYTLDQYQEDVGKTAIYPEHGTGTLLALCYVALKGAGEAGEFAESLGKAIRDEGFGQADHDVGAMIQLTPERKQQLIKEVGDQLWYNARKCTELGISLADVAQMNIEKLRSRQERGVIGGSGDYR